MWRLVESVNILPRIALMASERGCLHGALQCLQHLARCPLVILLTYCCAVCWLPGLSSRAPGDDIIISKLQSTEREAMWRLKSQLHRHVAAQFTGKADQSVFSCQVAIMSGLRGQAWPAKVKCWLSHYTFPICRTPDIILSDFTAEHNKNGLSSLLAGSVPPKWKKTNSAGNYQVFCCKCKIFGCLLSCCVKEDIMQIFC